MRYLSVPWIPLLLVSLLAACANSTTQKKWTEDVLLEDSTVATVERRVVYGRHSSWSGDISGTDEIASSIRFTENLDDLPAWSEPLIPILFYRDQDAKQWVIVALSNSAQKVAVHGTPPSIYWEFRSDGSGWKEVPLSPKSIGRSANLYFAYEMKDMPRNVSVDLTKELLGRKEFSKRFLKVDPPKAGEAI
jgi:hypothetical protein